MHGLTEILPAATKRPVGRTRINGEQYPAKFPDGTLARIEAVLEGKEKRADFIREAVEKELARREAITAAPRPAGRKTDRD